MEEWKFATMVFGVPCAVIGMPEMPEWYVDNWDIMDVSSEFLMRSFRVYLFPPARLQPESHQYPSLLYHMIAFNCKGVENMLSDCVYHNQQCREEAMEARVMCTVG